MLLNQPPLNSQLRNNTDFACVDFKHNIIWTKTKSKQGHNVEALFACPTCIMWNEIELSKK